jgi:hypothetical protein
MKNKLLIIMFLATALVSLSAAVFEASHARVPAIDGLEDIRHVDSAAYDFMTERMFEGTVAGKGHVINGLMYFPMKTADNVMEVQIGPTEFIELIRFRARPGEIVTVIGMLAMLEDRLVLLAREVRSRAGMFILRDLNGYPMWDSKRPVQMDTEFPESVMCETMKPSDNFHTSRFFKPEFLTK